MSWSKQVDFGGTARWAATSFVIGSNAYICCGSDSRGSLSDLWAFNFTTKQWSQKAMFPGGARYGLVSFAIGTNAYVGLGRKEGGVKYGDWWQYNSVANTWTKKADCPGGSTASSSGFALGLVYGYVVCGIDSSDNYSKRVFRYNVLTNAWTQLSDMPGFGRAGAASFVIGSKAYIVGGQTGLFGRLNDTREFDGSSWTSKDNYANNTAVVSYPSAVVLNNKGYVISGYDVDSLTSTVWQFDPSQSTGSQWVQQSNFTGEMRYYASSVNSATLGYIGIGNNGATLLKDWYEFNPSALPSFTTPFTFSWNVEGNQITKEFQFGWDVLGYTAIASPAEFEFSFAVQGYTGITPPPYFEFSWEVQDEVIVPIEFEFSWGVSGILPMSNPAEFEFSWNAAEQFNSDFEFSYDVQTVTAIANPIEFAFEWDVLEGEAITFIFEWDVQGNSSILDQIEFVFDWEVRDDKVNAEFVFDWAVEGANIVVKNIDSSWYNNGTLTIDINSSWEIIAAGSENFIIIIDSSWETMDLVMKKIDSSWITEADYMAKYKFYSPRRLREFRKSSLQGVHIK